MTTPAYYEAPESAWMFRVAAAARRLALRIQATIGPGPLKPIAACRFSPLTHL